MMEPKLPKYAWGERVQATVDLYNDGSYPDKGMEELLVAEGTVGEVLQVGSHQESNTPVYMVEFAGERVVGCLEQEIVRV
jgi:nitrogen fixation protein NifZ